ncbi:hypothetical protein [Streptomyces sp. ME01-18h]|uniref:hypothetical protein n=1 Tax=Streptomyces sp. ME01-18h TaxID=462920 RepID=UPI0029B04DC3|nr:hypothetical protein [Streptomyces sp. ME01-18h]MDX3398389.1 hypothetical protein [Streptomyces sp. ME01-18h]
MAASSQIPQLGPSTALVQLLSEHPELAPATWRIDRDGLLSGTVAYNADFDVRPAMAAYADVLGAVLHEQPVTHQGETHATFHVFATWRDVQVNVWASCAAAAVGSAVAA